MAVLEHEGTYSIMYGRFGFPVGTAHRPGYMARPDKVGRFPVVVVVPGIDGLTSHEKDLCRRFARNGIAAVSLDFFRHPTGDSLRDYHALSDKRAITDLDEMHEFLASEDVNWAHPNAVGMLGVDVGGRFAMAMAANRSWVSALAVCYSPLTGDEQREIQVADLLDHLPVPVMGIYGAEDDLIDTASIDEAQRRNEAGHWLLYEGARHDFMNLSSDNYDNDSAADAESRLIQFFTQTLPAAETEDLG